MSGRPLTEFSKWVAYREISGASFYYSARVILVPGWEFHENHLK
jgi:hypothetical protein